MAVLVGWRVWVQRGIACRGRAWSWVSGEGRVPEGVGLEGISSCHFEGQWELSLTSCGNSGGREENMGSTFWFVGNSRHEIEKKI